MSLNKIFILGRMGTDPELKYTPNGSAVCNFSVATTETFKKKDQSTGENTEWHRIVVWGKTAEACNQYLDKGKSVMVEGKVTTRSWEDKNGQKRSTTEIQASKVEWFHKSSGDSNQQSLGTEEY